MTEIQQPSLRITDPATARLLRQQHAFLALFVQPTSPTDAAQRAGMAANLAHHHARKLVEVGLLREVRRQGGKVYYQLTAREFRVPWSVLPPTDEQGGNFANLNGLNVGFRCAYERSARHLTEHEEHIIGFVEFADAQAHLPAMQGVPAESHPTHLDAITVRLTPERYRQLVQDFTALLNAALDDALPDSGKPCTIAVLAYQGVIDAGAEFTERISRHTSSFLGAQ